MTFENLIARHPMHVKFADYWELLSKLVAGGSQVDEKVKAELLINPEKRSSKVIEERLKLAPYMSNLGGILSRLESQLLMDKASYQSPARDNDTFWDEEFFPAGGLDMLGSTSFHRILKDATLNALTQQLAIAVVDTPSGEAETLAEQEMLGGNKPYVFLLPREQMLDWETDENGFLFVKLHSFDVVRQQWDDQPIPTHEFTIYQRYPENENAITIQKWTLVPRDLDKMSAEDFTLEGLREEDAIVTQTLPEQDIFHVVEGGRRIFRFPVCVMKLHPSMWLADQLYDSQVSLFNQNAAREWALFSTNYAQLIFTDVEDEKELNLRLGLQANGYYTSLPLGVKAQWLEREGPGIERAKEQIDERKEDMMQIIQQVSYAAAISGAGLRRSAESKKADQRSMDVMLEVYGQEIKDFAKNILDTATIARGSAEVWTVDGFDKYDSDSLIADLEQYMSAEWVTNSPTLKRESQKKLAAFTAKELGVSEDKLTEIFAEIDNNTYYLDRERLDFLESLITAGRFSNESILELLVQAQILPDDFNIPQELARLGNQTVDLGTLDENALLA